MRDISRIRGQDFASLDEKPKGQNLPSAWWRMLSILVYAVLSFVAMALFSAWLISMGAISSTCANYDRCNFFEEAIFAILGIGWFASLFVIIGYGWRGKLFGFRKSK